MERGRHTAIASTVRSQAPSLVLVAVLVVLAVAAGAGAAAAETVGDGDVRATENLTADDVTLDEPDLQSASGQTITGQTDLEAGTKLSVLVIGTDSSSPFFAPTETTVQEDGSFTATVDLGPVVVGASARVEVKGPDAGMDPDARTLASRNVTIQPAPSDGTLDDLTLRADSGQTITGQTEYYEETVTVAVTETDPDANEAAFETTTQVETGENGTVETAVDLSALESGASVEVTLSRSGTVLDTQDVTVGQPMPSFDDLALSTAPGQTVSGQTALSKGSTVAVRVVGTDGSTLAGPVETTVDADGTFAAPVDLGGVVGGTDAQVQLRRDGQTLASQDVTLSTAATLENTTLRATWGQTITGETQLPAGSPLTVRITGTDASSPFLKPAETTVAEDGSFDVTLDFSDVAENVSARIEVIHEGAVLAERDVTVQEAGTRTGTPTTPTPTPEPTGTPEPTFGFDRSIYAADRGTVVEFELTLLDAQRATVAVGELGDNNYVTNFTVEDGDGDGKVTVSFDTYTAGAAASSQVDYVGDIVSVSDGDSVVDVGTGDPETYERGVFAGLDSPHPDTLDAGDYMFQAVAGDVDTFANVEAEDVATLSLSANDDFKSDRSGVLAGTTTTATPTPTATATPTTTPTATATPTATPAPTTTPATTDTPATTTTPTTDTPTASTPVNTTATATPAGTTTATPAQTTTSASDAATATATPTVGDETATPDDDASTLPDDSSTQTPLTETTTAGNATTTDDDGGGGFIESLLELLFG